MRTKYEYNEKSALYSQEEKMDTIELFAGTGSFSKVAKKLGHSIVMIEKDKSFENCLHIDIKDIPSLNHFDILWASPPCTGFSVASIGKAWSKDKTPKSTTAKEGLELLRKTVELIAQSKPKYWFIENPRGMMRVVIDKIFAEYGIKDYKRATVTYCQYGDTRMKPTDIWTNLNGWNGKCCKNGASCHISAPRGSRTGTQGIKGAKDRSVIPSALFEEIFTEIKQ